MSEIIQTKSGKFAIFDNEGKLIGTSDSDSDDDWPESGFDDMYNDYERELDAGNMCDVGGYNDNFEELELPDKKRGIESKQTPLWSW